ncbi:MAG: hypothetical protein ABI475_03780 [Methylophilaceae bacterium]
MGLDIRTIIVMFAMLAFMFFGLLTLASFEMFVVQLWRSLGDQLHWRRTSRLSVHDINQKHTHLHPFRGRAAALVAVNGTLYHRMICGE